MRPRGLSRPGGNRPAPRRVWQTAAVGFAAKVSAPSLALSLVLAACGGGARPANDPGPQAPAAPPPGDAAAPPDPVDPDSPCTADADCVAFQQEESCCDMCGWRALTKAGFAAFRARCAPRKLRCPSFDCPYQARHAVCEQGRCRTAPDEPPRPVP